MEETPPCEPCVQLDREFELAVRRDAEQDARILALQQANREKDVRIAALEQRLLTLRRRRR